MKENDRCYFFLLAILTKKEKLPKRSRDSEI